MFITCIMIRLFIAKKNIAKTPKKLHKQCSNNKQNNHKNHNAFSIIKKYTAHGCGCYGRISHAEKNYHPRLRLG